MLCANMFARYPALAGFVFAILSAAAFGSSGALAKGLLLAGWSPAAVVTGRVGIGALLLIIPAMRSLKGRYRLLKQGWVPMVLFGLIAIAGCQLAYFLAVERLSVGVALLLEYLAVLLVVLWVWLAQGQRPKRLTIIGTAVAVVGLILVLNVFSGVAIDGLGVLFGLLAAVGLATFFVLSAADGHGVPPLVFAAGGLLVGTVALVVSGAAGIVPITWSSEPVLFAGALVPWWVALMGLGTLAAAFAYVAGIIAARALGSKLASFVGLSEVLFAVVWAYVLLGEMPLPVQLIGGVLILTGVVLVKVDEEDDGHAAPAV